MPEFNIYCDESCHLEHDRERVMVFGGVTCPVDRSREIAARLRELKIAHGLPADFEMKWTKVSRSKQDFYLAVLDYFFDDDDLSFRALVVPDKSKLNHAAFGQSHDDFYYKMYFDLLKVVLDPESEYNIYLDIKDTKSAEKTRRLHEFLIGRIHREYGVTRRIVRKIELVRSHHVQQVQLADLLIGAISYANRDLNDNAGKCALVARTRARARHPLTRSTFLKERKVNLLVWHAGEAPSRG